MSVQDLHELKAWVFKTSNIKLVTSDPDRGSRGFWSEFRDNSGGSWEGMSSKGSERVVVENVLCDCPTPPHRPPPSTDPLNTFSRHLLDDPSIERIYKVPREDFEGVWGVDPGGRGGVLAGPQPRPTRRCGAARLSSITRHPGRKT